MLILEIIRMALAGLTANPIRSLLTMLSMVIGVAAVVTMLAIGEGARRSVEDAVGSWGLNRLTVWHGARQQRGKRRYNPVSLDDVRAIGRDARRIDVMVPEMYGQYQIKWRNRNSEIAVNGTTPAYFRLYSMRIAAGRFFDAGDVSGARLVAVLGSEAAKDLGAGPHVVGQYIRAKNLSLLVVGVLEPTGEVSYPRPDEAILIPITTAETRLFGQSTINRLNIIAGSAGDLLPLAEQIERTLRREHRLLPEELNDFTIRNDLERATLRNEMAGTFGLLLFSIAVVSIVVGGIGIMNIMLVTVAERTRDIGVSRAVGATAAAIVTQYLVEAILLCVAGGALGTGLAIGAVHVTAAQTGWSAIVAPDSVGLAMAFSVVTGIAAGLYPAIRAAAISPVEALRYE